MRRNLFVAMQVVFAAIVVWFAAGSVVDQWRAARAAGLGVSLRWSWIAASSLIVLGTYLLLIEVWRSMLRAWGFSLRRNEAARIWFVSNLGRYVPGKVWTIAAMAVMAERAGVSKYAATGSSLVINLVNLLTGVGVVALTSASLLGNPPIVIGASVAVGLLVLAMPYVLPWVMRLVQRITGRDIVVPILPQRAIWTAVFGTFAAWLLYGTAFYVLARGVTTHAGGPISRYIAAFTASYILGYVMLFAPGGIGIRDASLIALLDKLRLTSNGAGVLVSVASRLWLTVLEIVPGAVYLALSARGSNASLTTRNASND